jgi:phosphoglycolate phosphatase
MKKLLLVFDWDGTLIDSASKIVACMQAAIDEHGLAFRDEDTISNIIGLGLREGTGLLFPELDEEGHSQLHATYAQHFVAADQVPCNFFPGALEGLAALREAGHTLAVATGKSRRGLNRVLKATGTEALFTATRCADETRSKPHPQMLRELLQECAVKPGDALMVGDTEYDLAMAANAGVASVGVSFGVHSVERLLACEPLQIVDSHDEFTRWLTAHCATLNT